MARLEFESRLRVTPRRRGMTLRGRLTLLALVAAVALPWWWSGAGEGGPAPADRDAPTPAVSSPPAPAPAAVLERLPPGARGASVESFVAEAGAPVREQLSLAAEPDAPAVRYELEYTVEADFSRRVEAILRRGRVALGHVVVMNLQTGELLAYESTDPSAFPATRAYPMASLMKIVTTAALLRREPGATERSCLFIGNPYRLTRARLDPPRTGRAATLQRALATSNNQCFAQIAVHDLGVEAMTREMQRMRLLEQPAPAHEPALLDAVEDPLELGRLGSGLGGSRISPLGGLRLAALLATGSAVEPRWLARVRDPDGRALALPDPVPAPALTPGLARRLRTMLVETTRSGTARRAFRDRRGRPLLGPVRVAGKTGSLSGRNPDGRYEWFVGVAPADDPRVAIATLVVNGELWWRNASQISADVLRALFCEDRTCSEAVAEARLAASPAPPPPSGS